MAAEKVSRGESIDVQPPRGMRDFFPEDMVVRDHLFNVWNESAQLHGFLKYEAPVVESFELLARKSGEEIADQIYYFEDKSHRALALRPEVTPSLVRMIASRQQNVLLPAKWYTIAQCFRYERMSKGRKREHFQWNLDIVGHDNVLAEAWLLSCAVSALRALGLTADEIKVHVNHRGLVSLLLSSLDVPPELHSSVFMALDKKDKLSDADQTAILQECGLRTSQVRALLDNINITTLGELKNLKLQESQPAQDTYRLFDLSAQLGISNFLRFDFGIIRGLSYYTGIVFEAFDTQRKHRAVFGGGRYDNLFTDLTGAAQSVAGIGFGDVVITELLKDRGLLPDASATVQICIGAFDASLDTAALKLSARLTAEGYSVDPAFGKYRPAKFFAYAAKRGAAVAILVAPDEFACGAVSVKDMATGAQAIVPLDHLNDWLVGHFPCSNPSASS